MNDTSNIPSEKVVQTMASMDWDNLDSELAAPAPGKKELSPSQVASFWWGCCGFAVLALLSSVGLGAMLELCVQVFERWVHDWIKMGDSSLAPRHLWGMFLAIRISFESCFVPSAVIASVVPILYWRGGLLQRFGLSLVIAICVMNVALSDSYYSFVESRWDRTGRILQIIACWVSLPMLFTYSPIRTITLRLIASSVVLTIAVCISILVLIDAPQASRLVSWQALYLAGFSWALFRRNWGNTVVSEGGTTATEVERTSSRTLMELMIISAIAIVAGILFTGRDLERIAIDGLIHFGLGLVAAALSIWVLFQFDSKGLRFWIAQAVSFLCITAIAFLVNLYENYFQQSNYYITLIEPSTQMLLLSFCSAGAGLCWMLHLAFVAAWFRICVWRISHN